MHNAVFLFLFLIRQLDKPVPIGQALEETLIKLSPLPVEKMPEGVTVSPEQEIGEILIGKTQAKLISSHLPFLLYA